jgi:hypothetical protein
METFTINRISEMLEIDRGTAVRMLKNVPPDAEKTKGRPTFKISTAAKALEAHRRAVGTANGGRGVVQNPPEYTVFDQAYSAMKVLPTLAKRRAAAVKLIPAITDMIAAMREDGRSSGETPEVTAMRSDRVFQLTLRGFEAPCAWSHDEAWSNLSV